jgi:hypothetical protein
VLAETDAVVAFEVLEVHFLPELAASGIDAAQQKGNVLDDAVLAEKVLSGGVDLAVAQVVEVGVLVGVLIVHAAEIVNLVKTVQQAAELLRATLELLLLTLLAYLFV